MHIDARPRSSKARTNGKFPTAEMWSSLKHARQIHSHTDTSVSVPLLLFCERVYVADGHAILVLCMGNTYTLVHFELVIRLFIILYDCKLIKMRK